MNEDDSNYCYYSDLPSPMAYMVEEEIKIEEKIITPLSTFDIDRIIEMAWEDRTPFDAIKQQFNLNESDVKALMKKQLKFKSYTLWRERVESCKTKHSKLRASDIERFKCKLQRTITHNKISKRH